MTEQTVIRTRVQCGEPRRCPANRFELYHGETLQRVLPDQVDLLRTHLLADRHVGRRDRQAVPAPEGVTR